MTDSSIAIVTGGAQGLGAAICLQLLKDGYKLCVADIQEVKGRHFVKEQQEIYGSENIIFSHCDVTKEDHYDRIFDATLKAFGKVDVLVNNAGIILEQDPRVVLAVNLLGPIIGCQKALKYLGKTNGGKGGIVINTASIVGFVPMSALPAYTASKHGVVGLTRTYGLPYHFARDGITFMALCPYFIDTDLLKCSKTNTVVPGIDFTIRDKMSPEYVAKGVKRLLEDKINGSTLVVTLDGYKYVGYQDEFKNIPLE